MQNTGLDKAQAGIKIAGRNINNLRCANDTTFMAESKEELNSLLMTVKKESEKAGLKLNIQKMKIMASGPIISWQTDEETMETVRDFIFLGSKITAKNWCFWTVVLEKTLQCPLDCKEIKPVNSKGNQSWIFIGRTDAEGETPVLWMASLMQRTWVSPGVCSDSCHWVTDAILPSHPLMPPFLPALSPSQHQSLF